MTEWLPLPIPMLPANDDSSQNPIKCQASDAATETASKRHLGNTGSKARAEREALEMMERAKAMMREGK